MVSQDSGPEQQGQVEAPALITAVSAAAQTHVRVKVSEGGMFGFQ